MPPVLDPDRRELEELQAVARFEGARVLELGCGEGRLTAQYAPLAASVVAIDPDKKLISEARAAAPGVEFRVADAVEFDGPASEFDLALFSWSL